MIVLDLPSSNSVVAMMLSLSMVLTADNSYMNYNKIFQLQDRGNYCKYMNTRLKPPYGCPSHLETNLPRFWE